MSDPALHAALGTAGRLIDVLDHYDAGEVVLRAARAVERLLRAWAGRGRVGDIEALGDAVAVLRGLLKRRDVGDVPAVAAARAQLEAAVERLLDQPRAGGS